MQKQKYITSYIREEIHLALKYMCFKYTYYNIFILLFSLFQYELIPIAVPFGLLILQELYCWLQFSQREIIPSLQHVLNIMATIFILVIYYINQKYYVFINLFVLFSTFLGIKWSCQQEIQHEYSTIFRYLQGFYCVSILIATLCVTIKLNELVNWSWSQTFWWYWMYLSALIGSAFTILMILISKLINQYYYQRISLHQNEYKTLLWLLLVLIFSSILSGAWIINTFNLLGMDLKLQLGIVAFSSFIIFSLILFIGTYFIFDDLVNFFTVLINQELASPQPNSPKTQELTKKQIVRAPILLKRLSTAYFRQATGQEFIMYSSAAREELFTERATNMSQKIISNPIQNQEFKRIKKSKQKTDIEFKKVSNTNSQCIICCEKQANAVMMKCGHGGICYNCAYESAQKNKECFLCRQRVTEIYEIELTEQGDYLKVNYKTKID